MTTFHLVCCGLIIHVVFLMSIFDIYFHSPIVVGVLPVNTTVTPLSKRVVLFSVDGLRLDSLFDVDPVSNSYVAEYVQDIIKHRGSWGVSESHVPTESRPGHVAMLAGFYEDPSAVTRGWKENPVNFDSIFNKSYCSFAWGSPDILQIFFNGLERDCAFHEYYKNHQKFAGDTREYDNWVFDKVVKYFKNSTQPAALNSDRIFFFLHLLGQDTSGHTDKPHTDKYRRNLKNVDELIKKFEKVFFNYYRDNKTTFIFTSDHGMTNWGSHGAGDPDETNTPFVAWGSGIKKPTTSLKQLNISQADITPLLAVLLGVSIPVNSVGVLPIDYLNASQKVISESILLNARQMVAQYLMSMDNIQKKMISWFHVPFKNLSVSNINTKIKFIEKCIRTEKYNEAIVNSKILIKTSLEGLSYYWNYYQKPLLLCTTLSYIGWIAYLVMALIDIDCSSKLCYLLPCTEFALKTALLCVVVTTVLLILAQGLYFSFFVYALLSEFLWYVVVKKALLLIKNIKFLYFKIIFSFCFIIIGGVEVLVVTFFHRWFLCFSIGYILLWSLFAINFKEMKLLMTLWLVSGFGVGLFSLLPTVGGQPNLTKIILSGTLLCLFILFLGMSGNIGKVSLFLVQLCSLIVSVANSWIVHNYFNKNQNVSNFNQVTSWSLLFLSCCFFFIGNVNLSAKLFNIFTTLSIPFVLLSISHEVFFFTILCFHMYCWILLENQVKSQNQIITNFRVAYFFLTYIFLSFFGLGNLSSLNSFDPAWVRCFLTIFSPFLMTALILLKTIIPFLVVTCTIRVITITLNINAHKLFIIVLIFCNIMGLNFLFLIKNKGSWLDIGTSISHYVIQQVTIVFLVLLFAVAKFLIKDSKYKNKKTVNQINIFYLKTPNLSLPTFHNCKVHVL